MNPEDLWTFLKGKCLADSINAYIISNIIFSTVQQLRVLIKKIIAEEL